jgi:aerobic-type carbon monoxide dehydrogenase small subunit (CoxS/CutS family)
MEYLMNLKVNGKVVELRVEPQLTLLEMLRDKLGLTGTKEGCGTGDCGACTVLLDGAPVNSCLMLALEAGGHDVLTIEGLGTEEELHPLQRAFIENGAAQCGFCTPGMLLTAHALLMKNPNPDEMETRLALSGNLCRCTGYDKIIRAVRAAAGEVHHG